MKRPEYAECIPQSSALGLIYLQMYTVHDDRMLEACESFEGAEGSVTGGVLQDTVSRGSTC